MATKYKRVKKRGGGFLTGIYYYESHSRPKINSHLDRCFIISFKIDNKKKWEKIGWESEGYTPQIASEVRAERIRALRHGERVKTSAEIRQARKNHDKPLKEIKNLYFESEHGRKIRGRKFDLSRWNNHLRLIEEKRVSELTVLDIEKVKRHAREQKLSPQTLKHILALLKRVINFGVEHGQCLRLAFKIKMPAVDNERTEYLTPDQVQRLMDVLAEWPSQDVARMVKLALFSGMRKGEIFKLQIKDVDFRQGLITIRAPKGGRTQSIPLNQVTNDILKAQIRWTKEKYPGSPFVFPGRAGEQRVECTAIRRIKKAANLPKNFRPFHGLRHHFAVTLASSGNFTLDMIGELLTHKDTKITRRYAKYLPEAKRKAAEKAARLVAAQAGNKGQAQVVKLRKSRSPGS